MNENSRMAFFTTNVLYIVQVLTDGQLKQNAISAKASALETKICRRFSIHVADDEWVSNFADTEFGAFFPAHI